MKTKITDQFNGHYQDFYGKYLKGGFKKLSSDEYQGLCPFHEDKKPSFIKPANKYVHYAA